ncbi:hypothetical protein D3C86_1107440 [compost metagenome]
MMQFNQTLSESQTNTRAQVHLPTIYLVKPIKYPILMLYINTNTCIAYFNHRIPILTRKFYIY